MSKIRIQSWAERSRRSSKKYCAVCKLHVRGKNHEDGSHHLAAIRRLKG